MLVSNNATAHDVVKFLSQLHYPEERLAVVETTYTKFIDRNVELLVHGVAVSRRPTQTPIKDVVLLHYLSTFEGTASAFSNMVAKSISHVRVLSRSTTSGKKTTDQSNVWRQSFRSKSERWRAVWSAVVPTHSPRPHALKCPRSNRSTVMTRHAVMQQLRACAQIVRLFSTTSSAPVAPAHSHTLQNDAVDSVVRLLDSAQARRFLALALSFRRAVRDENPERDAGRP